jgi:hypothetical protein
MNKKTKIIIAIVGGALTGALGTCAVIYPGLKEVFVSASALVAMVVALITGITPTAK